MAVKDLKEENTKKAVKKPKKEKVKKDKVNKVKKTKNTKNLDTVVFVDNEEQAEQILKEVMDAPFEKTEKKTSNFWSELKSLFLIILIIGGVVGVGFLVFKYAKPFESKKPNTNEENKVVESSDYKTVLYKATEDRKLRVIDSQYVIEYNENTLFKVLDMDGNELFSGNEEFTDILIGIDDELYLTMINHKDEEENSSMGVYKFHNKELVEVINADEEGYGYTTLIHNDGSYDRLIGIVGENYYFEEDDYEIKSVMYTLNEKKYELSEVRVTGDTVRLSIDQPIYTYNQDYVVVKDTNSDNKNGVYDIKNGEIVVNTKYDGLYTTKTGNYIAVKGKNAGIINIKSKILVDFKYDFISDNGNFYVVGKNNKLGILDNEFKEVIKPTFTFQQSNGLGFSYTSCCGAVNTFNATKYKDKYVLTVNNEELSMGINYKVHETYAIDSKGEYLTIGANEFGIDGNFIYGYDKDAKKYTIYDENFAEKYTIDISKYDFEDGPYISLVNENTIVVSLDTELYYDYATGEEVNGLKDATFVVDKIEFKYIANDKKVTFKVNGEEITSYTYEIGDNNGKFYNNVKDKLYYYITSDTYAMVRKSE